MGRYGQLAQYESSLARSMNGQNADVYEMVVEALLRITEKNISSMKVIYTPTIH